MFQKLCGTKIFYGFGGGGCDAVLRIYVKTFYLTMPRNIVVAPSVFQKCSGIGKFYGSGGLREYHDFTSKFFASLRRNIS